MCGDLLKNHLTKTLGRYFQPLQLGSKPGGQVGTASLQTREVGKVALMPGHHVSGLPTVCLPAFSNHTQAIAIGTLDGGWGEALLNPRNTHSLLPLPWGEEEPWLSTS